MAGTITRKTLLEMTRVHLHQWPEEIPLASALQAAATNIELTDTVYKELLHPKAILQIEDEVMRVLDVPEDGLNVRVLRGYMGTTKATHAIERPIKVFPSWGWTDHEFINYHLPLALKFLKPFFWTWTESAAFTWAASSYTATTPAAAAISYPDGNHLIRLLYNDGVDYRPFTSWRLLGNTLHFREKSSSALTLKAEYAKFQGALSSDTATLDLDDCAEPLAMYMASLALNALKSNRIRYAEYSASLNDRASTADELIRMGYDLRNQAIVAAEQRGRVLPGEYISTYRDR